MARRQKVSPGGVGDGLPSMPDGEPLLQRWFVVPLLLLVVIGIGVTIWMAASMVGTEAIPVAERRPPGTAEVTHERGQAVLNETAEVVPGPGCAERIELFGDRGARETGRAALEAVCGLLGTGEFPEAQEGFDTWSDGAGQLRIAVFELTGVESSARVVQVGSAAGADQLVIELNPRFQFEPGFRAAPMILHELVHVASGWPGQPVDATAELAAMQVQHAACEALTFDREPPRGCLDAALLADDPDALQHLRDAGYGHGSSGDTSTPEGGTS